MQYLHARIHDVDVWLPDSKEHRAIVFRWAVESDGALTVVAMSKETLHDMIREQVPRDVPLLVH